MKLFLIVFYFLEIVNCQEPKEEGIILYALYNACHY